MNQKQSLVTHSDENTQGGINIDPPSQHKMKRSIQQFLDTVNFEFIRNRKKSLILLIVYTGIFVLFYITQQSRFNRGVPLPEDPLNYVASFLGMIDLLVMISSCAYGGFVVARDYKEKTGHLLFPKTTKERLLFGRMTATFLLNSFCIFFYYSLIAIATTVKYDTFPTAMLFKSFGWAIFYMIAVLIFVIFWSSVMKSTTLAIIVALLMLWMVFSIIEGIMSITTTMEPYFLLTYYSRIISNIFDMPDVRYTENTIPVSETETFTMRSWTTPSIQGAVIGLLVYSAIFLLAAYLFFKRRQFKN